MDLGASETHTGRMCRCSYQHPTCCFGVTTCGDVFGTVPIETAPFDGPFGRTFTFTDPDGDAVTIHDKQ